jgi:D-cysteine desulfhydrase
MTEPVPLLRLDDLVARLERVPRLALAHYPTPLQALPRLSVQLGVPLYLKRDDEIGPALGGSKTRKLEYELAHAQQQGARKVVTFGGLQSNHARLTAGAARQLGLEPHLLYFAQRPRAPQGNLLLNQLAGAQLHFIRFGRGGDGSATLEQTNRLVRLVAMATVGPHYFIPAGGHSVRGALGYARAALELDTQARTLGIRAARVIVAAGTGGTLAGLLAGLALCGSSLRVLAIDIGRLWKNFPGSIARLATGVCRFLGSPLVFRAGDVPLIEHHYVGPAYAVPTEKGVEAIRMLARSEGVFLDPVYTGKAFAGLVDLVRRGELGSNEPLIFLHTGGSPALYAYPDVFTR